MSETVVIRPVRLKDTSRLNTLIVQSINDSFTYFAPEFRQSLVRKHSNSRLARAYFSPYAFFYLAAHEGRIVGYNLLRIAPDKTAFLLWMYVAPTLRGQHIGSRLVHRGLAEARRRGAHRLELITHDKVRYYEHHGFKSIKRIPGMLGEADMTLMEQVL